MIEIFKRTYLLYFSQLYFEVDSSFCFYDKFIKCNKNVYFTYLICKLNLCTLIFFINSNFNFLSKTPIHSCTVVESHKGSLRFKGNFGQGVKGFQFFLCFKNCFCILIYKPSISYTLLLPYLLLSASNLPYFFQKNFLSG